MLDKRIPYIEFLMRRNPQSPVPLPERYLPEGYSLAFYTPGDEGAWCRIETAVGEFASETEAATYFQKNFAPFSDELRQRMMFIVDPEGEKVATCTAWRTEKQRPLLHWLAVKPEAQQRGVASYLAVKTTALLEELHPNQPIELHTQTWSHQAIGIYEKLGYELIPSTKDYEKGLAILERVVEEAF